MAYRNRQQQIEDMRRKQNQRLDNDFFFDKFDSQFDKALDNMPKTFLKFGLIAVLLNVLWWSLIIAGIIFGISLLT